ncbi:hypothetical protein Nepgr_022517 [Nepenthes gracilis]|uniref:Laccase n=1 Tax=Nepenthes gracilis TaxID=150966 RepID=A0AAD3T2Q8_NEPGR|nr:hypothetical protein Nepgr_022517 [Nepenthes gracilis]
MGLKRVMSLKLQILGFLVLKMFVLCKAEGNITTLNWFLQETSYTRLCSTKNMLTVNGQFPGPALRLHRGDTLRVNVYNQGTYNVTIHWHGVKQPRNPWSDGPEYVAQCPIQPGNNFTYEIILSDEEGTLWWHAHSDWTRATVHGPIFIYPPENKTYPFSTPDAEIPIVLASWFKGDVMQVIKEALASGAETNKSDAFTINGQPGDTQPCSNTSMFNTTVDHGKTYLLRIINAIMNEEMFFMVANHTLTVVGVDGAYVKPITTKYIMITPGQTMDVLLSANQSLSHYYIAARAFGELVYSNATTTALLLYSGNYTAPSQATFPDLPYYNDSTAATSFTRRLRALATDDHPIDVPKSIDTRLLMTIAINTLPCELENGTCSGPNDNRLSASLNNVTFYTPEIDVLQAYYKNIESVYKEDFPDGPGYVFNFTADPMLTDNYTMSDLNGTRLRVLEYNSTVEIVFQGTNVLNSSENHPMHLHGFSFYVVGWGWGNFDEEVDPQGYNLIDPPEMNTAGVPRNGWLAIRFRANNPGVWFMHCHLERHSSWGMDTVLIVKNGPTQETSLRAPQYINPC